MHVRCVESDKLANLITSMFAQLNLFCFALNMCVCRMCVINCLLTCIIRVRRAARSVGDS